MRIYIYALMALVFMLAAQPVFAADMCNGSVISGETTWPTDNGNGTITDANTNLTWSKCLYGQSGTTCTGTIQAIAWATALGKTTSLWRLPNIKELQSIVKEENAVSTTKRAINTVCFPTPDASTSLPVWSSSPYAADTTKIWTIDFQGGFFASNYPATNIAYVRYVCDGDAATCNTTTLPVAP